MDHGSTITKSTSNSRKLVDILASLSWIVALILMILLTMALPRLANKLIEIPNFLHGSLIFASAIGSYVVYYLMVRYGENRAVTELSLAWLPQDLIRGVLVGLGMFLLVFASLRLLGVYTIASGNWTDWGQDILEALTFGLVEELVIRLVLFRLLAGAIGIRWALIASALAFGGMHLMNPNASCLAAAAIAVEAGLMLAGFYLMTGRIWLSVGVHAAWNFAQGAIFGARVSGMTEAGSLFVSAPTHGSSTILSGGEFGPEASLSAMLVGLAIFAMVLRTARSEQISVQIRGVRGRIGNWISQPR